MESVSGDESDRFRHEERDFRRLTYQGLSCKECFMWRSPHKEDPTLTLPLPRGGDRRWS
ncbi:hypothetical protein J0895_03310 [Phormidium pseudopriestleyi FRX01]|uniref:Uncharacterized protein n=1 Tax=Phormidium pseudopriestleyi FRX01 TaxID=1759528 RepID=A0ABS3FMD7_9CYAN|nr:hypothetical protein [Phormidium pseudopriestleyi FRX01]